MTFLKQLSISFILSSSILTFAQNDLPISEGHLNGEYSHFDSENQTTTAGNFKNNLRDGKWIIKDTSDNIVYKRNYKSIYSYTETRISGNEGVFLQKPYALKRNDDKLYEYPKVEIKDVLWTKRVWSILPETGHGQLYSQELLIRINKWVNEDKIVIYKDDELSTLINKQDIDLSDNECVGVTMKKDYFFDKELGIMIEKIVALTFHVESAENENMQTFSIYYPTDGRKLLSSFSVSHESDKIIHYDDLFFFQNYTEIIYNEANAKGIKIDPDFTNTEQYQKNSNAIKQLILSTEHRLWLTD